MNKRQKKKNMKNTLRGLEEGQGIIIGNGQFYKGRTIRHHFNIGTIVRVGGRNIAGDYDCYHEGLYQTVSKEHVLVK